MTQPNVIGLSLYLFLIKDIPLFDSPSQPDLDVSFLQGREKQRQRLSGLCKDRGLVGEWN